MKKIISIIFCLLPTLAISADKEGIVYDIEITRVIDGDTVAFVADFLPDPLKKELSIRVYGVDTPEKGHRAKCGTESDSGLAASEFTKSKVAAAKRTQMRLMSWDKYGGRVLGDVILDGHSLRLMLIEEGYAREYFGEAKESWCN